ncbi:nuclear transport factor 2 family protein [Plantactinospora sp. WMMB782]|uniref:nuclear transport factor 2 family protein n=1 Tax=Plantactinospora sp. WMMB782 TaxID=3404121 RepID=UPI003B952E6D
MDDESELTALEKDGWRALASDPPSATRFYDEVLDDQVRMLLPGGMILDERRAIVESMGGTPWASYRIDQERVLRPVPDTAVVTYRVVASRPDSPAYEALICSTYVRRGSGWKMVFHQQTPV